jgi:tetratricopeptide (TPR) repeat protein
MSTDARHPPERTLGLTLPGRYLIRRHVATGGMASVWCGEDRLLSRTVAIKVLSERIADDPRAIRRFKREARAAARVSAHPHVVTIFDVGDTEAPGEQDSPSAFIVMEYLAGGTVANALRSDSVTRADVRRWLREAASALDHAHERGVVHRDIKPANFLLDRGRSLHIADFGIARLQSEETITSSGELFGTAAYLAPEQALGRDATSASDLYSLAVAAFELLTGGRPFTAPHFAAQARQHVEDHPPRASDRDRTLPAGVDQVLWRGMAKEPEARYATAGAFVDALERALDGDHTGPTRPLHARGGGVAAAAVGRTAAASPTRSASAGRRRTGRRAAALAAVAALAIVAVGVIVLITQLHGGSQPSSTGSSVDHAVVTPPARTHRHARRRAPAHSNAATAASPAATAPATTSATTTAAASTPAPAPAAPQSAAAVQLQGHDQMLAGAYPAAIATLQRALREAAPGSLTYAYALYDLGRSLLLSGDPKAAIPLLEQRLKIPNQTGLVRQTLDQALQAAGEASQATPGGAAPVRPSNGNGSGHGPGGGPGQGPGKANGHGNGHGPGAPGGGTDDGGDSGTVSGGDSVG